MHDSIVVEKLGLHLIKTKKLSAMILELDSSKAYDREYWLYLRLMLIHNDFCVNMVYWIMECLTSLSFTLLITVSTSSFFRTTKGLRQGCSLPPLLFMIIIEGLSKEILEAKRSGVIKGIK